MNYQLETNQPDTKTPGASLRLFVYGTLKRDYWNHERFCRGVLSVEEAIVRGRLYELPSGIPVLEVSEADVLAYGTVDPLADLSACNAQAGVATQARLAAEFAARAAQHPDPGKNGATGGRWGPVYGELLTFDDLETRLPAIDHLEGFLPCLRAGTHRQAGGPSLYRRVLVPASTRGQRVLVWLYVEGAGRRHPGRRLADGVWQA